MESGNEVKSLDQTGHVYVIITKKTGNVASDSL